MGGDLKQLIKSKTPKRYRTWYLTKSWKNREDTIRVFVSEGQEKRIVTSSINLFFIFEIILPDCSSICRYPICRREFRRFGERSRAPFC
jgi:hypothetical protein